MPNTRVSGLYPFLISFISTNTRTMDKRPGIMESKISSTTTDASPTLIVQASFTFTEEATIAPTMVIPITPAAFVKDCIRPELNTVSIKDVPYL